MTIIGIPPAADQNALAERRRAEAEALTNDVVAGIQRTCIVWNKAYDQRKSSLTAGEHTIGVLQGMVIAAGQQAAALTVANPSGSAEWLETMLLQHFKEAFAAVRKDAMRRPASPREQ